MTDTQGQGATQTAARLHLFLFLLMLGIAALLGWSTWMARSMVETFLPQADAAAAARLQITEAHLWLEEIVSGDASESPQQVWDLITRTRSLLQALQTGDSAGQVHIIRAVADPEVQAELVSAQKVLQEFERLSHARIGQENAGVGTAIDGQFDDTFENFIAVTGKLGDRLHASTETALTRFTWLQVALVGVVLLLFGGLLLMLRRQDAAERDSHVRSLRTSYAQLERSRQELEQQNRLRGALVDLGDRLQGLESPAAVAQAALDLLCERCNAQAGSCWNYRPGNGLQRLAGHALPVSHADLDSLQEGEGLLGRAALDRTPLAIDVPSDYFVIASGIGQASAPHLRILPLVHDNQSVAVIELAFLQAPGEEAMLLLESALPAIAIRLHMLGRAANAQESRRVAALS